MSNPAPGNSSILGQSAPAAATNTKIYTGPAALQVASSGGAQIACIAFTETNGAVALVRISFRVAGAADNVKQYVVRDYALNPNEPQVWPGSFLPGIGSIPIGATDEIWVQSDTGNVSFTVFGVPQV